MTQAARQTGANGLLGSALLEILEKVDGEWRQLPAPDIERHIASHLFKAATAIAEASDVGLAAKRAEFSPLARQIHLWLRLCPADQAYGRAQAAMAVQIGAMLKRPKAP